MEGMRKLLGVYTAISSASGSPFEASHETKFRAKEYKRHGKTIDESLDIGAQAWSFLTRKIGEEGASRYMDCVLHQSEPARVPYGFWPDFCREMELQYNNQTRQRYQRSLETYIHARNSGGMSREALRGNRQRGSKRLASGDRARKAPGLGAALLQFFVDEIQWLKTRADSCLLLAKARQLRNILIENGFPEDKLPKLNPQWLWRWRKGWGIVMKGTGMQLKVAWRKVIRRVRVLLMNLFRLSVCKYQCTYVCRSVRTYVRTYLRACRRLTANFLSSMYVRLVRESCPVSTCILGGP